jgi:isopentenyldiphosphate isomerase
MEILSIVNENDEVIGQEDRKVIHQKGLRHREVHVWFVTRDHKVIFQKRGLHKETFPGLFDATVGGHVEIGESYEDAAIREAQEETGIIIPKDKLFFVQNAKTETHDNLAGLQNNTFKMTYSYVCDIDVSSLKLEDGDALGFEAFSIDELENISEDNRKKFIKRFLSEEYINLFKKII